MSVRVLLIKEHCDYVHRLMCICFQNMDQPTLSIVLFWSGDFSVSGDCLYESGTLKLISIDHHTSYLNLIDMVYNIIRYGHGCVDVKLFM